MATRYFKATDGTDTFFRASSGAYESLTVDEKLENGWTLHRDGRGRFPAVEITRQEYKALTALKVARCERKKAEWVAANPGKPVHEIAFKGDAPRDSWVSNDAIEAAAIVEKHNREGGPALLRELFRFS